MKSICLLSGGLDSLVSLALAKKESEIILALTFDYGQKAFKDEKSASQKICDYYNIPHKIVKLDWLKEITKTSLVNKNDTVPVYTETDLSTKQELLLKNVDLVWVPNRNGVFVNIGAAFAESLEAEQIVCGFNSEEAANFSDNSLQFVNSANALFRVSTLHRPKLVSYVQSYQKPGIVTAGLNLKVPFEFIYSCYNFSKDEKMCGCCESCVRIKRAFKEAGHFGIIESRFLK